jgi:hypothetical protein
VAAFGVSFQGDVDRFDDHVGVFFVLFA